MIVRELNSSFKKIKASLFFLSKSEKFSFCLILSLVSNFTHLFSTYPSIDHVGEKSVALLKKCGNKTQSDDFSQRFFTFFCNHFMFFFI